MFEPKRGDKSWQPFSISKKPVEHVDPDLSNAREVKPILMRTNFDFANTQAISTEGEAEATAETDPKASSATSSVSAFKEDSNPIGDSKTQNPKMIHPSFSPPPAVDDPASVEKESKETIENPPPPLLIQTMNLGSNLPSVEG